MSYTDMCRNVFMLLTDPNNSCRDVIRSRDSALRITVYCLDKEDFIPNYDEIQLYAVDHGRRLAFETHNILPEDALDMAEAIQWYAQYLGYPDMQILADDPRV